jgi:hypothetical protein
MGSNTFPLSTSKTVRVKGIHFRHCPGPFDISRMATGGEIRLHVSVIIGKFRNVYPIVIFVDLDQGILAWLKNSMKLLYTITCC